MRWMTLAVVVILFAQPGNSVAGPPEKISGVMVFDEVADGLRKYRQETDTGRRIRRLEKLALTRDPRVAIVLGDLLGSTDRETQIYAAGIIDRHFHPFVYQGIGILVLQARVWWMDNQADLRRRAEQIQ